MGSNPAAAGFLAGCPADRLAGQEGGAAAVIDTAQAATGAGPSTRAKFCFWVRQRFACWRAKFPGRLTSDKPPTTISHCCGLGWRGTQNTNYGFIITNYGFIITRRRQDDSSGIHVNAFSQRADWSVHGLKAVISQRTCAQGLYYLFTSYL